MQTISNASFANETVCLDNKHFDNCVLTHCVLEYSGQELTIERTSFEGCRLKLSECAGRTLLFLQCMGYMKDGPGGLKPLSGMMN